MGRNLPTVRVADDLRAPLRRGHPWLYADHIPKGDKLRTGQWVRVVCAGFSSVGVVDAESPLRVRLYRCPEQPGAEWIQAQVAAALERRRGLLSDGQTSAYRLLNGEGDGLPGIVIDVYGPHAVMRLDSVALRGLVPLLLAALDSQLSLKGVCRRSGPGLEVLNGRPPPERLIVTEHGLRFFADLATGQKTGLFLDHRENRRFLEPLCAGKRVLNLFAYTGGFSLYAARGGASRVVSVDRAAEALARANDNFKLNGMEGAEHAVVASDVEAFLKQASDGGESFDVIVNDPPSFARSRDQRKRALRAYERLHAQALRLLAPGGLYAAASCSSQIAPEAFRETVAMGAARARRCLQIASEFGHACDHPIALGHPEGRYLKFIAARCTSS